MSRETRTLDILRSVDAERRSQDVRWGTIEERVAEGISLPIWMTILTEEVGELAEAILDAGADPEAVEDIRAEAVQVAAVAVAIVESLEVMEAER